MATSPRLGHAGFSLEAADLRQKPQLLRRDPRERVNCLEHLRYVAGDPLIARFCGLACIPAARTVGNWLRQFTQATLGPLVQLNHDLVIDALRRLALPRLTIDLDGTGRSHKLPHPPPKR